MHHRAPRPAAALAALLLGALAAAAPPDDHITLTGQTELARLLDLAAARRGITVHYPDDLARRKVLLRTTGALTDEQLWSLTNGLLQSQGLATVEIAGGHGLSVVPIQQAPALARTLEPGEPSVAGFRAQAIDLAHASPAAVEAALRPLLTPQSGATRLVPGTRRLIIADHAARIADALRLAAALDGPHAQITTTRIDLRHTTADRAIPSAVEVRARHRQLTGAEPSDAQLIALPDNRAVLLLARRDEAPEWIETLATLDAQPSASTRVYPDIRFDLDEVAALLTSLAAAPEAPDAFRIVPDRLTGSLIVTGTPDQHQTVESALARLRAIPDAARLPTRAYTVRHRDVQDVAAVLADLLDAGIVSTASDPAALDTAPTKPPAHALVIDPGSNTIYISAPTPVLEQVQRLVPTLDVQVPQVQVEVMLVSLSESQARDLGIELQHLLDDAGTLVGLSSLFGLGSPALSSTNPLIGGAGGTAVILDPGDFSVVVRALETVNRGRTLSMPSVLVNNNEGATIDSVLQQPFISTNASDTVATTSFGGFEDAGTQVTVTPQIAAGDHLVLRYSVNLSSFVGEAASPEAPPPRQQNSVSSVATIPDGFTVVVGGIELNTEGYAEDRVPLLGEVPLLGNLFKNTSRSGSRQRFYAFIRATVLRDRSLEGLKYASEAAAAELGVDDGWPTVEPRVIR